MREKKRTYYMNHSHNITLSKLQLSNRKKKQNKKHQTTGQDIYFHIVTREEGLAEKETLKQFSVYSASSEIVDLFYKTLDFASINVSSAPCLYSDSNHQHNLVFLCSCSMSVFVSITDMAVAPCHTAHSQHRIFTGIFKVSLFYDNCVSNLCQCKKGCMIKQSVNVPVLSFKECLQVTH